MAASMTDVSAAETAADLGVWAELIGQTAAVATLRRAVAGEPHAMSHAWLFTGPPGSGRSNAARAFAAALQCRLGRLRALPCLPYVVVRCASRRHAGAYRTALDRRGRGARAGPPSRHESRLWAGGR